MQKEKKALLAITKGTWGGAQRYVYDLATHLAKEGFPVTVVMGTEGELARRLAEKNVRTIIIGSLGRDVKLLKEFSALKTLFTIVKKERPDILHLNSSKMGAMGGVVGRLLGTPHIVFTAHGWAHVEERPALEKFIIKMIHQATVLFSHTTIAVSDIVKNQIGKTLASRIVVIHNGADAGTLKTREEAREFLNAASRGTLNDISLWIGTLGELHKNKGLSYAIEGLSKAKTRACLVIIGDGEEKETLQKIARDVGVSDRVFFLGHISNASLYLKAFDIFMLPSVKEGFPYAILEAGYAEIPIIATAVGGIPEVIDDLENGILVQPKKSVEIAAAIDFFIEN